MGIALFIRENMRFVAYGFLRASRREIVSLPRYFPLQLVWSSAAISNIAKRVSEKHCMFVHFCIVRKGQKFEKSLP